MINKDFYTPINDEDSLKQLRLRHEQEAGNRYYKFTNINPNLSTKLKKEFNHSLKQLDLNEAEKENRISTFDKMIRQYIFTFNYKLKKAVSKKQYDYFGWRIQKMNAAIMKSVVEGIVPTGKIK